ncbi:uncharacterized protein LOC116161089 [Photinus pyralis]|uniref:Regulatory protein zeste n=1 Tax=Photinus pyralis TaxID=7054 RepID=A0A1Y1LYC3_PHOPY|nr:uncharacterized protein LOC116161089 [Photinus pyralis]
MITNNAENGGHPLQGTVKMTMATDKRKYVTCDQKSVLVDFIKTHYEMAKPRLDNSFTVKELNSLWEQLSCTLNRLEGATKSSRGWRKCWHDLRRNTKEKVAKLRLQGRSSSQEELTPIQEKVRALIEENDLKEPVVFYNIKPENDALPAELDVASNSADSWAERKPAVEQPPVPKQKRFRTRLRSFAERKLHIKKSYYNRKLALLEQHIQAINRQTDAINKQTVVHERLMQLLNPKLAV